MNCKPVLNINKSSLAPWIVEQIELKNFKSKHVSLQCVLGQTWNVD